MPERVIDGLELVEVDERQSEFPVVLQIAIDGISEELVERRPIGEAGQRVHARGRLQCAFDFTLLPDACRYVEDDLDIEDTARVHACPGSSELEPVNDWLLRHEYASAWRQLCPVMPKRAIASFFDVAGVSWTRRSKLVQRCPRSRLTVSYGAVANPCMI